MHIVTLRFFCVASLCLTLLSGCGLLPDKVDETKNWSADKLYAEASSEIASGNYERAIQQFEKLEARYPFGRYAQQAQLQIAYAHYKANEQKEALQAIERFIQLHPDHPNVDYAYYLRGLINFNDDLGFLGRFSGQDATERDPKAAHNAFEAFKDLTERFPNSKYASDAIYRMKYLIGAIAQHEVHVAQYYYNRGAYLAAANRAQFAIKEYKDAPAIETAFVILIKSYDALGLTTLRDDAKRVLEKNFPNNPYLKKL